MKVLALVITLNISISEGGRLVKVIWNSFML